jgi:ferritin-like metal-binding protein YciE
MSALQETFIDGLRDIYDAEHQIVKALPDLIEAASHEELKSGLQEHLDETRGHIERVEKVFEIFDETPKRKKCKGAAGLIDEGREIIKDEHGDAALISAAQKVEHYEIAAYGSLSSWARLLEKEDAVELLEANLNEEKQADEK